LHINTHPTQRIKPALIAGFTLIELSIVLVIIGLIVGGVLVGQDLIRAAEVRAQITQIEKFNTAVNTFRGKFGALPGDLNNTVATTFGFAARGLYAGEGDGNGIIEGIRQNNPSNNVGYLPNSGEALTFWGDIGSPKAGNLIDGSFPNSSTPTGSLSGSGPDFSGYLPLAKIGKGNSVYIWTNNSINYYGLSVLTTLSNNYIQSNNGLTVRQAYDIDKKIDDGLPQSGRVLALRIDQFGYTWANGDITVDDSPITTATPSSPTTCYDNSNSSTGAVQQYSLTQNKGAGVNCSLSFQFQ
jgi:prepilin-type N-terminal cleavage/methylation domain-containing protein